MFVVLNNINNMVLCFNCSSETKKKLDELMSKGSYRDYSDVIATAIHNTLLLHDQMDQNSGIIIRGDESQPTTDSQTDGIVKQEEIKYAPRNANVQKKKQPNSLGDSTKIFQGIPEIFIRADKSDNPPLVKRPFDMWSISKDIPVDRWLFGQYNKILPLKANCRALSNLTMGQKKGITIDEIEEKLRDSACQLGDYLIEFDRREKLNKDNAFSTAFPSNKKGKEKSAFRYINQFVASINKQQQLSGALFDFKLINRVGKKGRNILLTQEGLDFANLKNPVLDNPGNSDKIKISKEEQEFLLNHIKSSVPIEDYTYRILLKIISEGNNSPTEIDSVLSEKLKGERKSELSSSFLSTQRSGSISRMQDLGLITRIRNGVRITYEVTELGNQYIIDTKK